MATDKDYDVKVLNGDEPERHFTDHNGTLADPEMEGLTLYERKALLVNRELDSHGMGKYQWYIFFLCGFGYLIDLLYAQAFGLIEPAIQQEFGFAGICFRFLHNVTETYGATDKASGNIFSSFSAGLTAGVCIPPAHCH
jgi:hypothetical protein